MAGAASKPTDIRRRTFGTDFVVRMKLAYHLLAPVHSPWRAVILVIYVVLLRVGLILFVGILWYHFSFSWHRAWYLLRIEPPRSILCLYVLGGQF